MFKTLNISTSTVQTLLQQSALQLLSAQHSSPAGGPQVLNSLSGLSDLCPAELNTSSPPLSHSGMLASLGLGQNMGMGGGQRALDAGQPPWPARSPAAAQWAGVVPSAGTASFKPR